MCRDIFFRNRPSRSARPAWLAGSSRADPQASTELWLDCAGTVVAGGNPNVMLVEAGRKTDGHFEIDLVGVRVSSKPARFRVIVVSVESGTIRRGSRRISRGALGAGAAGIMIDVHPNPLEGFLTDGYCLSLKEFEEIFKSLRPLLV